MTPKNKPEGRADLSWNVICLRCNAKGFCRRQAESCVRCGATDLVMELLPSPWAPGHRTQPIHGVGSVENRTNRPNVRMRKGNEV